MRTQTFVILAAIALGLVAFSSAIGPVAPVAAQEIDAEVPPGNPVIGDERPGDIAGDDGTNYALWGLVAVCLIGAGVLLVKIEKWEARRIEHQAPSAL